MKNTTHSMEGYIDLPCERCGSKKRVSETWKEKIPTYTGEIEVEYSQIICTNEVCQKAFDKNLVAEKEKRDAIRQRKEANELARKKHSVHEANKARKTAHK